MVARNGNGQFRKGSSGNPAGRPPGRSTREIVRGVFAENDGAALADWVRALLADPDVRVAGIVVSLLAWLDGPAPAPESAGLSHEEALMELMGDDWLSPAKRRLLDGIDTTAN